MHEVFEGAVPIFKGFVSRIYQNLGGSTSQLIALAKKTFLNNESLNKAPFKQGHNVFKRTEVKVVIYLVLKVKKL